MIPQSELDRIEREAKLYGYVFDGQRAYDNIDRIEGYEEGASSEYLRSASRMEELLRAAQDVFEMMKLHDLNQDELKLMYDLESAITKFTTEKP